MIKPNSSILVIEAPRTRKMEHKDVFILKSDDQNEIEMLIASEEKVVLPIGRKLTGSSVCTFLKQENNVVESEERSKSKIKLSGLIGFYLIVMTVEVIGGVKANSLSVITDAAHLLIDVVGFSISLFSVWASGWEATSRQSFGYSRLEVLGAFLSVQLIWLISGILVFEAIDRMVHKSSGVNGMLMFAISLFGCIINFLMVMWLGHDHSHHHPCHHTHNTHDGEDFCATNEVEESKLVPSSPAKAKILNINIQGAYLHVMADLIQSVGVMIAGAIIWAKPGWLVVDLICTLLFSTFVLFATLPMLRDIFSILMERTPREIDIGRLERGLKCIEGVEDVHNLRVWSLTLGKLILCSHVIAEPGASSSEILRRIREYCEKTHRIHDITIQIEQ